MAGENAVLQLVTDIREGMKEVKADVKELRTEVHTLSVKFAEMGETQSKIANLETRMSDLSAKIISNEDRLRDAEQKLVLAAAQSNKVEDLQKDYWKSAGKIAGIGAAILAFISIGGLLVKLLGS
jgi:chromosome segregation ATPase